MATEGETRSITVKAGADLRTQQYKAIAVGGTIAATNALAMGLLATKCNSGQHATLDYSGEMKGIAGAAITAGARVKVTTSGYLIAVNSGDGAVGKALAAASSGAAFSLIGEFAGAANTF